MHYSNKTGRNTVEADPQNSANLFFRLKELHEIEDQSRVEQCPIFPDQQFLSDDFQGDNSLTKKDSLLKELEEQSYTQQQTGKIHSEVEELKSRSKCIIKDSLSAAEMLQINNRLIQDNQKLFQEVIRLRKVVDSQPHPSFRRNQKPHLKQSDHNSLTIENLNLKTQIKIICQNMQKAKQDIREKEEIIEKLNYSIRIIPILQKENGILLDKILFIQKDYQQKIEGVALKSSLSSQNNSTTFDSKKTQVQKDRMITNMKVVYESEVKKLKNIIQNQRKEIQKKYE